MKVITQFYATLYYDHEENQTIFWMIEGEQYKISYRTFSRLFGFDFRDTSKTNIHVEEQLSAEDIDFMYENHGEVTYGSTKGMRPFYKCLNSLFCPTLNPKSGDASTVQGISRNLLAMMSNEGDLFSVVDFLWEEIHITSYTPSKICAYTSYIMYIIVKVTKKTSSRKWSISPIG